MSARFSWAYHFLYLPVLTVLPRPWAQRFAHRLAARSVFHHHERSGATLEALGRAQLPDELEHGLEQIRQSVFETQVWEDASAYRMPFWNAGNIDRTIRFEGLEYLEEARRKGQGGLLIGAHFGLLCGGLVALHLKGYPVNYLANNTPEDPSFDRATRSHSRFKIYWMERKGGQFISFDLGRNRQSSALAVAESLNRLRNNEFVAAMVDVVPDFATNNAEAQFLGTTARFPTGFLRLAQYAGAAVIPHFTIRHPADGTHTVIIERPVSLKGVLTQDLQSCVDRMTQRIQQSPGLWMGWETLAAFQKR